MSWSQTSFSFFDQFVSLCTLSLSPDYDCFVHCSHDIREVSINPKGTHISFGSGIVSSLYRFMSRSSLLTGLSSDTRIVQITVVQQSRIFMSPPTQLILLGIIKACQSLAIIAAVPSQPAGINANQLLRRRSRNGHSEPFNSLMQQNSRT